MKVKRTFSQIQPKSWIFHKEQKLWVDENGVAWNEEGDKKIRVAKGAEVDLLVENPSDTFIANEQGISRQAINERRSEGWSQEEIEAGKRGRPRPKNYRTPIAEYLGKSVKEAAAEQGVTGAEIYRRYHKAMKTKERQAELAKQQ
jgi:hypothetical protein